ncbi:MULTISPECIES: PLD nuclease N-terminal domain-containing protein [Sutcliffiella]|uniref:Transcriptional regulator n=1 Tax=Sutcliffiella cohnii TaxID=33932 RepID=A0A223KJV4_9BACI|nr:MULTISPECIES: PLD nuclease N-terminal domain-containing protein [Sutcliffiella]AST89779.1 transcriptional regulator [Sutcliffiella cohnii]WBL15404.1 PLD nuclease N-terminal domain-containing protein [Sutcliffiella sp. NC1]
MEELMQINWAIIAPIFVLQLILMVFALISCLRQDETNGPKWLWVLVIIFINILGPILYFVIGKKNN